MWSPTMMMLFPERMGLSSSGNGTLETSSMMIISLPATSLPRNSWEMMGFLPFTILL